MATDLISDIWPEGLQRAIGQVILISALVDTLASVFSEKQGLSGERLRNALQACPEPDLRAIGTDYYALYQQRNDLVHGFCVMPDGVNLISERTRGLRPNLDPQSQSHTERWRLLMVSPRKRSDRSCRKCGSTFYPKANKELLDRLRRVY